MPAVAVETAFELQHQRRAAAHDIAQFTERHDAVGAGLEADRLDLGCRHGVEPAAALGQPVERIIVMHHRLAVGGDLQIGLDAVTAGNGSRRARWAGGGAALKLFPLLAKKNGLDPAKVEIVNMAPNLQEQMLIRGDVDISALFTATSYMNLVAIKQDFDKDFRWIYYSDGGLDLYSNGVMVSQKLAKEKPEAVKGLVRAINKAMKDCLANPDAAIELLAKQEPLLNKDIEKRRLIYVAKTLIATPEAAELGVGDMKDARMSDAIATIAAAYELPKSPAVGDVFNRVPAAQGGAHAAGGDELGPCGKIGCALRPDGGGISPGFERESMKVASLWARRKLR